MHAKSKQHDAFNNADLFESLLERKACWCYCSSSCGCQHVNHLPSCCADAICRRLRGRKKNKVWLLAVEGCIKVSGDRASICQDKKRRCRHRVVYFFKHGNMLSCKAECSQDWQQVRLHVQRHEECDMLQVVMLQAGNAESNISSSVRAEYSPSQCHAPTVRGKQKGTKRATESPKREVAGGGNRRLTPVSPKGAKVQP